MRARWSQPLRLAGKDITIDGRNIGDATVDLRQQIDEDGVVLANEIRIRVGKDWRDRIGGTSSALTFHAAARADGQGGFDTMVEYEFPLVNWRRSCCKLLGYA